MPALDPQLPNSVFAHLHRDARLLSSGGE
jgi:hypothetical protein